MFQNQINTQNTFAFTEKPEYIKMQNMQKVNHDI